LSRITESGFRSTTLSFRQPWSETK
jgi:hypothetical protein